MATMRQTAQLEETPSLRLVHPLDDAPEQKVDASSLGPMHMTPRVRWSLLALRAYLIAIVVLVVVRVCMIAAG